MRVVLAAAVLLAACEKTGAQPQQLRSPTAEEGLSRGRVPPVQPAPPDAAPVTIAPTELEANRLTGDRTLSPDDAIRDEIARSGVKRVVIPVELCVRTDGTVSSVAIQTRSPFAAYDAMIESEMRTWTFAPFLIDGAATPICTSIKYIYVQTP